MFVEDLNLECRPDEAIYLENLATRPRRHEPLRFYIRRARQAWVDRVLRDEEVEVPTPFTNTAEARFVFRFAEASRRWEPFASLEPHPITIELANPRQLLLVRNLAAIALYTAENQVINNDQAYAVFEAEIEAHSYSDEVRQLQAEQGITEEMLKADFFGRALDEVYMATRILKAIAVANGTV